MIKYLFVLLPFVSLSQSFAPEPGANGSTAIHKDSSIIIAWAQNAQVTRGPLDIQNPGQGNAIHGAESDATGTADNQVVSLGDGGEVVLEFEAPIENGSGFDFVIFENGFIDHYMELAFVEVSSDGINFHRFDAISEIDTSSQLSNFDTANCRYVHNLAGKYRVDWGTPFDLAELDGTPGLDVMNITHVKLIDAIGSVDPLWGSYDSQGHLINDPYPTAFPSGGFDLDALGVIHQKGASLDEGSIVFRVYPNPVSDLLSIEADGFVKVLVRDCFGRLVLESDSPMFSTESLESGMYHIECITINASFVKTILKQ